MPGHLASGPLWFPRVGIHARETDCLRASGENALNQVRARITRLVRDELSRSLGRGRMGGGTGAPRWEATGDFWSPKGSGSAGGRGEREKGKRREGLVRSQSGASHTGCGDFEFIRSVPDLFWVKSGATCSWEVLRGIVSDFLVSHYPGSCGHIPQRTKAGNPEHAQCGEPVCGLIKTSAYGNPVQLPSPRRQWG